jgi:hypothetical protein
MVGMFGGDAVERKYGKLPPAEWTAMLSRLKPFEVDRGIRRLAYSGKAHVPTLPEFTHLCRAVADDSIEEGIQRPALPNPDAFVGDEWDIEANQRLLKHITTILAGKANANALGEVPKIQREYVKGKFLRLKSVPSPQQVETTAVLVAYKKAWAQDMREWGLDSSTGEVMKPTTAEREAAWKGCMQRAQAEIARILA